MDNLLHVKYISKQKGKGVFAKKDITKGTLVDNAHIVLIPKGQNRMAPDERVNFYQ